MFRLISDSLRALYTQASHIQSYAYQESTKRNMRSQLQAYLNFCTFYKLQPFPVIKSIYIAYLIFLSRSLSSYRSLINYITILKHVNRALGADIDFMEDYDCYTIQRGLRRVLGDKVQHTLPVTTDILISICRSLDPSNILHVCMHAVFLVAFFSFLRISNLFPYRKADVSAPDQLFLRRRDVTYTAAGCFLRVHKTKTLQFHEEFFDIPIPHIANSILCPVTALRRYCHLAPAAPDSPLFVLPCQQGNVPVLVSHFNAFLKRCISSLGLDSRQFSSRSFRKGGATFAFNSGAPTEFIKAQGTWKSDAYLVYLNLSPSKQLQLLSSISNKLSNLS